MKKILVILKSIIFWIILLSLAIIGLFTALAIGVYKEVKKETAIVEEVEVESYVQKTFNNFTLFKDSTQYQIDLFDSLETTYVPALFEDGTQASGEEVENYVDVYAKNFVADYLTLSVKDLDLRRIGGVEFMHPDLQKRYIESFGVADYYTTRDYFVSNNSSADLTLLPEIVGLELIDIQPIVFDFKDKNNSLPQKDGLQGYSLVYTVSYDNTDLLEFNYYGQVTLKIVNWDGIWTVIEVVL